MKIVLVTPGDPDGIGPEIVAKCFRKDVLRRREAAFVCVGAEAPFRKLSPQPAIEVIAERDLRSPTRLPGNRLCLLPAPARAPAGRHLSGFQSGWSIAKSAELILSGRADALVTGPISKARLQLGGYPFSGHTDLLAALCKTPEVTMMLANDLLRVTLVTVHTALKNVPTALTRERLRITVEQTLFHLTAWWGIRRPRIAVAALNPHAGEGGLFGCEEERVISPTLDALRKKLRKTGASIEGPLPADTLFANHSLAPPGRRYDAVVCMYHDQGLIPVKLLDFKNTVNVTLGLPLIRTSVDHGTAFDIAGGNLADPSSLRSAIDLAVDLLGKRKKHKGARK